MPLDTGSISETMAGAPPHWRARVRLDPRGDLGAALRAAREGLGLDLETISAATRVSAGHLAALERLDFARLPSRPFVIGYLRAYAIALGVEPDSVVARFRAEAPPLDESLRAPIGLGDWAGGPPRWLMAAGVVILGAVLVWNVARHAQASTTQHGARPAIAAAAPPAPRASDETAHLGAPLPAPPEATTPTAYVTPGLPGGLAATTAPAPVVGAPFTAAGTIYGAPAPGAGVVLQARAATSLVVRGPGGAVYFARQLAPGEAWRAPALAGLVADAGNPDSIEVFAGGLSKGLMPKPRTAIADLAG